MRRRRIGTTTSSPAAGVSDAVAGVVGGSGRTVRICSRTASRSSGGGATSVRRGQLGRGGPQARDLGLALGALGEVSLEGDALALVEGVDGIRTGESVDIGTHGCIPRVSRRRIKPSLIRVLAVPRGTPRRVATSVWV